MVYIFFYRIELEAGRRGYRLDGTDFTARAIIMASEMSIEMKTNENCVV